MPEEKMMTPCPICEKPAGPRGENRTFPFCSARCKNEDLGKWLGGAYAVPGRAATPEEMVEELTKDQR